MLTICDCVLRLCEKIKWFVDTDAVSSDEDDENELEHAGDFGLDDLESL